MENLADGEHQPLSIETVRVLLEEQEKALKGHFEAALEEANRKIDKLNREVRELKDANEKVVNLPQTVRDLELIVEYTQKDRERVQQALNKQATAATDTLEQPVGKIKEQVLYLENQSRRYNLRIDGVAGSPNEDWDTTERKLQAALIEKLNLDREK